MSSDYESMTLYDSFHAFLEQRSDSANSWRFWHGFVFQNALAYISLYLSIRGGLWDMRMGSLKEMCPLFAAFDRLNYHKIIPQHIADKPANI
jgi:hypothetical protein